MHSKPSILVTNGEGAVRRTVSFIISDYAQQKAYSWDGGPSGAILALVTPRECPERPRLQLYSGEVTAIL